MVALELQGVHKSFGPVRAVMGLWAGTAYGTAQRNVSGMEFHFKHGDLNYYFGVLYKILVP
jgi:hypothetical protein